MKNYLNITSELPFDKLMPQVISVILPARPEYIYFDEYKQKRGSAKRYFFSAKTKKKISAEDVSKAIAEWIMRDFSKSFAKSIVKEDFVGISENETCEITNNAIALMGNYEKTLAKKILIQKLAKYFEDNDSISIEGFLRFRATELRRKIEEHLLEEIDALMAKKEYHDFVDLLKEYLSYSKPELELLHIRINTDKSFSLYNFQKEEFEFWGEELIYLSEADRLLSIILSINPKRIIWHDKTDLEMTNLANTLTEIFGDRFSICSGCTLCESDKKNL